MRKWSLALVLVLLVSAGTGAASYTMGLSISTLNNPFFVDLQEGAQDVAAEMAIELIITDAQNDSARQLSSVEDMLTRGIDILLINPTDSAAVIPAVRAANNAGVPVITVDRGADGGVVVAHVASDNVAGGRMAAEHILDLLGGQGRVVELEGIPGTSAARDRGAGFNEVMDEADGITIVGRQEAGFDRARGLTVMENILQAQPDIHAVFAHNDEMALGALTAIRASGRDIMVVGFDAVDDAVAAVNEGRMAATVAQKPRDMGRIAVEMAYAYLEGDEVPAYVPVELALVTKE